MPYAGASGPVGGLLPEPAPLGLGLQHEHGRSVSVTHHGAQLLRYVTHPWDPQLESPRPYVHPLRTLSGQLVSLYRPHDHVWHKGLGFALPNVGEHNFWGGPTYTRGPGYRQSDNDGSMRHRSFDVLHADADSATIGHVLDWVTAAGETAIVEHRRIDVTVAAGANAWVLTWSTRLTNVSGGALPIGSPATEGREGAGYAGLFWRGPRSWTGGTVLAPGRSGDDDLNGVHGPWLGFTGRHDEGGDASTLVFVDAEDNLRHPTPWFVRSGLYACLCPAPFGETEYVLDDDAELHLRYAVVVADGEHDPDGAAHLAALGAKSLTQRSR
ncbi:PmoA family protein [Pseudonocardia xinjiangensis]|uniref:Methane monooxygenase PmoA-like n=1 Tax=Pseudonocardia xinjiangensis TaxID=75289 RepID=A0ABX1RA37_9PSEU|nr:PmoA family protein [Pseudonocardia xinjiangensis]NMH76882.1 hypothetical protein [Pseudonocardia xinjiangensis]